MKTTTILILSIIIFFTGCYESDNLYLPNQYTTYNPSPLPKKTYNAKLKPYCVLGKWYCPIPTYKGEVFRGVASWYGPNFHGKLTANGEIYNMYEYTAANKILPLGTIVKVTNLNNNKSVVVRINDRGPFVKGRIIDLSYIAGKKIGIDKTGTAPVKIVVLSTPITTKAKKRKYSNKKMKKNGKISIQIGAFKKFEGAKFLKNRYKYSYIKKTDGIYKVYVGHFNSENEAINFKNSHNINGFIVRN